MILTKEQVNSYKKDGAIIPDSIQINAVVNKKDFKKDLISLYGSSSH